MAEAQCSCQWTHSDDGKGMDNSKAENDDDYMIKYLETMWVDNVELEDLGMVTDMKDFLDPGDQCLLSL